MDKQDRVGNEYHSGIPMPVPCAPFPLREMEPVGEILLDPAFPYGEHLLQFLWEGRLFDARELRTTHGLAVEVIDPGRIQGHSGPDLSGSIIRINGQLWAGTVEVHVRASEWNAHGHQHDPAYNNVVLHVVYRHDADVTTVNGQYPPTVELIGRIDLERVLLHQNLMLNNHWVPCAGQVQRVDAGRIGIWLDRVLVERMERRTAEVETLYKSLNNDPLDTFYHLLLRGLGFKVNAEPFAMLAHVLPLRILLKYRDDPFRTEALLFGQAGSLQVDHVDEHPRLLQSEYRLLSKLHGLRPMPVAAWKFGRMRPANFPSIRLAQLAQLIARGDGAFEDLIQHDHPDPILERLNVQAADYWSTHFRFDEPSAHLPKRLGRSSGERLIANTIVPYLFAIGRLRSEPALMERALALLELLPPERNTITENWEKLGVTNPNAAHSQALIELKNTHCRQRRCLSCVIGAAVLKDPSP